jgi:type IV pilus assembly protein PilO
MANFNLNFNLNELELEEFGSWPLSIKVILVGVLAIAIFTVGFLVDTKKSIIALEDSQKTEVGLKTQYEQKRHLAVNLQAYREQVKQLQKSFGLLLRQLPEKTEVPALIEDISQQGLAVGLEFKAIKLLPEQVVDFYVELPIELSVVGNYHQLAEFVSKLASLPRIVTLHNFSIVPLDESIKDGSQLLMIMTAKTYRYASVNGKVKPK